MASIVCDSVLEIVFDTDDYLTTESGEPLRKTLSPELRRTIQIGGYIVSMRGIVTNDTRWRSAAMNLFGIDQSQLSDYVVLYTMRSSISDSSVTTVKEALDYINEFALSLLIPSLKRHAAIRDWYIRRIP